MVLPSQVEDRKELDAPLGLGFEWPEADAWVWAFDDGSCTGSDDDLLEVSTSAKGIFALAKSFFGRETWTGGFVEDGFPLQITIQRAEEVASNRWSGLLLVDDNGVEIDRRWLR